MSKLQRLEMLVGEEGTARLKQAHVALFGVGGVGGYVAEALARSGVGSLTLYDDDVVSESNINRQLVALETTVGQPKVEVMARRIEAMGLGTRVYPMQVFYTPDNADRYPLSRYSYVVDAIDTVSAKLELIVRAKAAGVPILSCMGTGNKLDPTAFRIADITKTTVCPLARVMRRELKNRGIAHCDVLYSTEPPLTPAACVPPVAAALSGRPGKPGRSTPGSTAFCPGAAGLIIASRVVRDLLL